MQSKKDLSERDICTKYINPALQLAGWDIHSQVREEVGFTAGRIIVKGSLHTRGTQKRADYILYYKPNLPIAIIEAKDNQHGVGDGMQQALEYARILDIPFVYATNGDAFLERDQTRTDGTLETELSLDQFPSPDELWRRYKAYKGIHTEEEEKVITQDYYFDPSGKSARYYQHIAINRTVEAIGTGKTYMAFQIIWRLWKSGAKKRILFLADRNALIEQTKNKDFKPFRDKMTLVRNKAIDKSFEIYLALYQGLTNYDEALDAYKQFSPNFFDLIVVDECHRGSAAADSAWREILTYFGSATQIGLTATPKETTEVSNSDYFGDPVYTYSLKQGIDDGFLAPYKVIRIGLDKDLEGWRPEKGKQDKYGRAVEDRLYNTRDYDRTLVIEERTKLVARKVSEFLKATDRAAKTIVFCVDIDHAERMRQALVNENADLVRISGKYIMRITGDNEEGKRELDSFTNPESKYPVIATTSKLMTTGVDAETCKLIVLDSNIGSMSEFKQIIGRGTRINEAFGKYYFTIMDFRNVTDKFADPDFDGEPVKVYEPGEGDPITPPEGDDPDGEGGDPTPVPPTIRGGGDITLGPSRKVYVNGVEVKVLNERVQYYGHDGKLITESLKDYNRGRLRQRFRTLAEFLQSWQEADRKQALLTELEEQGLLLDELLEATKAKGPALDAFDLICHVAFDQPPLTRKERADNVKKRDYFTRYGEGARKVLEVLLEKYADKGIASIESTKVLELDPFRQMGTPTELIKRFGDKKKYMEAIKSLEDEIYKEA